MLPANEALKGGNLIRIEVVNGLIVNLELIARERSAEVDLQQAAGLRPRIHAGFEETIGAPSVLLGAV